MVASDEPDAVLLNVGTVSSEACFFLQLPSLFDSPRSVPCSAISPVCVGETLSSAVPMLLCRAAIDPFTALKGHTRGGNSALGVNPSRAVLAGELLGLYDSLLALVPSPVVPADSI